MQEDVERRAKASEPVAELEQRAVLKGFETLAVHVTKSSAFRTARNESESRPGATQRASVGASRSRSTISLCKEELEPRLAKANCMLIAWTDLGGAVVGHLQQLYTPRTPRLALANHTHARSLSNSLSLTRASPSSPSSQYRGCAHPPAARTSA